MLLSALHLFCFAALLDPFLNIYDERFHALVAKNLVHHPLMPTLYDDPIVNMPNDKWDSTHIWLHKQPLFLWQIALSFKLFGISEFTLRLPSVLLGVILVFIGYRVGKLMVNERTGFLTATLNISSFYNLELVAGRIMVDHNDFSFLVYVSLSIWAFIGFYYSKKKIWIYLIGLFSGFAILCKWLTGLLVYFGWFVLKVQLRKYRPREFKDILVALSVTFLIALSWQFYTAINYPHETSLSQAYNIQHLYKVIEGHRGTIWYHFDEFNVLFGSIASFLIIPGFIILYEKLTDKRIFAALISMVCITYLFFSLVQTKMPGFPVVVSLLIYLPLATLMEYGFDFLQKINVQDWVKKLFIGTVIMGVFFIRLDISKIQEKHTYRKDDNSYTRMLVHNKEIFQSLNLPVNAVIFNVKGQHYIESMFYTGLPSYRIIPSAEQCQDLKNKGRVIAIFKPVSGELPDYLINDKSTILLDQLLQGYN